MWASCRWWRRGCCPSRKMHRALDCSAPAIESLKTFIHTDNPSYSCAERGHVGVIRAVAETLLSSTQDCYEPSGHASKLGALGWTRYLKDYVINARTAHGQTPLILACEQGCAKP